MSALWNCATYNLWDAYAMSFQRKKFIVLTLGDMESWGWDEQTLPLLLQLVDSSLPDYRMSTNAGVVANYLTSPRALQAVEQVIAGAERLRDQDPRFGRLGIGLAEGELHAEYDVQDRLVTERSKPMGAALTAALRCERKPLKYQDMLRILQAKIHGNTT